MPSESRRNASVVIVAGAEGIIGTKVVGFLQEAGFDVLSFAAESPTELSDASAADLATAQSVVCLRQGPEQDRHRLEAMLAALGDQPDPAKDLEVERHLVLVSSASVYGAWPENPIPIDEEAKTNPNPETPFALRHAEAERIVSRWAASAPGKARTASILRPAPVVSSPSGGPVGEALLATAPLRASKDDPPVQFLHIDDLARAVVVAVRAQLDGVFNVAPNGWLSSAELRALLGARPKMRFGRRMTKTLSRRLDRYVARRVGHEAPMGIAPYVINPWVVSNERLKQVGFVPRYSNEQAFVYADAGMPWDDLNARQRQYVSLTISAVLLLALGLLAVLLVARRLKARRLQHNLDSYGG